ncbi:hypothetical protein [Microbacterium invictum]|uniref:Lipoprotein n=1 Tax=Microbacterium invictum TaxID=515415 RepID=A0AA40SPL4_9MICO|nr:MULTISPECIES: hypothetical protein [Microbacterium]MBB4139917.1 hypothetical protein [Microbacterium invictum]
MALLLHRLTALGVAGVVVFSLTSCASPEPSEPPPSEPTTGSPGAEQSAETAESGPAGSLEHLDNYAFAPVSVESTIVFVNGTTIVRIDTDTRTPSTTAGFESAAVEELAVYPGRNGTAVANGGTFHAVDLDTVYSYPSSGFASPPTTTSYERDPNEATLVRTAAVIDGTLWLGSQATRDAERASGRSVQLIEFAPDGASVVRYLPIDLPSREAAEGGHNRDDNDATVGIVGGDGAVVAGLRKGVVRVDTASGETTAAFDIDQYQQSQGRTPQYGSGLVNILLTERAFGGDALVLTVGENGSTTIERVIVLDPVTLDVVSDHEHEFGNGAPARTIDGSLFEFDGELWALGLGTGGILRVLPPASSDAPAVSVGYLGRDGRDIDPISGSMAGRIGDLLPYRAGLIAFGEGSGMWIFDPGVLTADDDPEQ